MDDLLQAAKAVIEEYYCEGCNETELECLMKKLRATVERAEEQEVTFDFREWWHSNNYGLYGIQHAQMSWTAAQQAERERIRARVRLAAISSWSASEVYIGPPLIQLQKFVDRLLEDSDAPTE